MSEILEIQEKVYSQLLNYLSYRDRTKKELLDKTSYYLHKYELSESDIQDISDEMLTRLREAGLVDDVKFSREYIKSKLRASKPFGRRKIYQNLLQKGISRAVIEGELSNIDTVAEKKSVEALFDKKFSSLGKSTDLKSKQKIIRYLLGRGCAPTLVYSVVDSKFKDE